MQVHFISSLSCPWLPPYICQLQTLDLSKIIHGVLQNLDTWASGLKIEGGEYVESIFFSLWVDKEPARILKENTYFLLCFFGDTWGLTHLQNTFSQEFSSCVSLHLTGKRNSLMQHFPKRPPWNAHVFWR